MTQNPSGPDAAARLLSHALVGLVAASVVTLFVARRHAPQAQLLTALVAVALHEKLDAPVATTLSELGF